MLCPARSNLAESGRTHVATEYPSAAVVS